MKCGSLIKNKLNKNGKSSKGYPIRLYSRASLLLSEIKENEINGALESGAYKCDGDIKFSLEVVNEPDYLDGTYASLEAKIECPICHNVDFRELLPRHEDSVEDLINTFLSLTDENSPIIKYNIKNIIDGSDLFNSQIPILEYNKKFYEIRNRKFNPNDYKE